MRVVFGIASGFGILSALLLAGCNSESEPQSSRFWDESGDVRGQETRLQIPEWDIDRLAEAADVIAVVRVTGITETERQEAPAGQFTAEDPSDQAQLDEDVKSMADIPVSTHYSAEVTSWVKGEGDKQIEIVGAGGLMPDGTPVFFDGFFLLEPGRSYLLMLAKGLSGGYHYSWARSSFDVTDGVKVLDHPWTQDIQYLEDSTVADLSGRFAAAEVP